MDATTALQQNLGRRIVQAARLAVTMHLADALMSSTNDRGQQQIGVGGADLQDRFKDEALTAPADGRRIIGRSFPSADGGAA